MSNNKQSSVDLLFDHMVGLCEDYDDGKINYTQYCNGVKEMYQKAKAMHKEEICTAFRIGENFAVDYYMESELDSDEQYYYETFNNESTN